MKSFYTVLFLIFFQSLSGQNTSFDDIHVKINYHYGYLLAEYDFFNYFTDSPIRAFNIELIKDLKGEKLWQRVYHYPSFGISYYYGSLGNDTVFGRVHALYPFMVFPLIEKKKILISTRIGTGLSYVTQKFDLGDNIYNIAVGSHFNIWFRAALDLSYRINDKINVSGGTAFGHFSNANLQEPNLGLNFWTFYSGLEYYLGKKTGRNTDIIPSFSKKNEFAFIAAGGGKHTRRFAERFYFAGSISGECKRIFGYKGALGAGADFFYDSSIPDEMIRAGYQEVKSVYKIKTGLHLSQELIVGKLSLIVQEGFYIGLTDHLNNRIMYNRGIIRYKLSKHLFANLAMKTNLWILDVAELGVGYYFDKS